MFRGFFFISLAKRRLVSNAHKGYFWRNGIAVTSRASVDCVDAWLHVGRKSHPEEPFGEGRRALRRYSRSSLSGVSRGKPEHSSAAVPGLCGAAARHWSAKLGWQGVRDDGSCTRTRKARPSHTRRLRIKVGWLRQPIVCRHFRFKSRDACHAVHWLLSTWATS